jgi:hypothetical protein
MSGRRAGFTFPGTVGFAASLAFLTGCATMATEPPPGALKVEVGAPAPGTRWVSRTVDHTGTSTTETWTAIEDGTYEGRPVYRFTNGVDLSIRDKATRSWIATVREGKARFAASPHDGSFSPPLWVGKGWRAIYAFYDHERGRSFSPVDYTWRVAASEDVTVPAGTFKAFRLEASNPFSNTIHWYAPEAKLVVKRIYERFAGHYLGSGKFTTELIEYPAK